jgi:mercuric ion transport protein
VKTLIGSVIAAAAASICCLGPIVLSVAGAGALGAAATGLEPLRPILLAASMTLLGLAFHFTYRSANAGCEADGTCAPSSRRATKMTLWVATLIIVLLAAFPYYVEWFV